MPHTLILGLGNPILGDDGIGWEAARRISEANLPADVEVDTVALGGISLMERMIGYERVIIIDAMNTSQFEIGSVQVFPHSSLPAPLTGHLASAHDASLNEALQMGRELGANLPAQVWIVAVETPYVYDFSEQLSPVAEKSVDQAVQLTIQLLADTAES